MELAQISICASAREFHLLGEFLIKCASAMEDESFEWDHEHFRYSSQGSGIGGADVIACKLKDPK